MPLYILYSAVAIYTTPDVAAGVDLIVVTQDKVVTNRSQIKY